MWMRSAAVLMVEPDEARVEQELQAGRLRCPECDGELRPWGHARRRKLRRGARDVEVVPRRSRCRGCDHTHVLLPTLALLRRRDLAEMIGDALLAKAAGMGGRRIAARVGAPLSTVQGWLARFSTRVEAIRAHFIRLAFLLGPGLGPIVPTGSAFGDALQAILIAWEAAARRFRRAPLWSFVSGATAGRLINTSPLLPLPG